MSEKAAKHLTLRKPGEIFAVQEHLNKLKKVKILGIK